MLLLNSEILLSNYFPSLNFEASNNKQTRLERLRNSESEMEKNNIRNEQDISHNNNK